MMKMEGAILNNASAVRVFDKWILRYNFLPCRPTIAHTLTRKAKQVKFRGSHCSSLQLNVLPAAPVFVTVYRTGKHLWSHGWFVTDALTLTGGLEEWQPRTLSERKSRRNWQHSVTSMTYSVNITSCTFQYIWQYSLGYHRITEWPGLKGTTMII